MKAPHVWILLLVLSVLLSLEIDIIWMEMEAGHLTNV